MIESRAPQSSVGVAPDTFKPRVQARQVIGRIWRWIFFASTAIAIVLLGMLLWSIIQPGWGWLSWNLVTNAPSRNPEIAGMNPAIWGSIWIIQEMEQIGFCGPEKN